MTELHRKGHKEGGRTLWQRGGSVPVCGGRPHRQRGDGADGLAVRVSPQPPPLRLQVGEVQRVGRVPHAAPVFPCRRKRRRTSVRQRVPFLFFLLSDSIPSGGEVEEVGEVEEEKFLHCIIKKKSGLICRSELF